MNAQHRIVEPFSNRDEAGRALAARLLTLHLREPIVVIALPRGGVPVAAVVARSLHAALDLLLVRKIGVPGEPELAVAAIAEGEPPELVIDEEVRRIAAVDATYIQAQVECESQELARRRQAYLSGRPRADVQGCTVIVVDDGIATGTTMRAALRALRRRRPARLVLAVPVAAADTLAVLRHEVDQVVCLAQPEPFRAVGLHYEDFEQVSDDEVIAALNAAAAA